MKPVVVNATALLSREEFKRQVFLRSRGQCVFCTLPAVDAHHILDRKLYGASGGYFLGNGAAVCAKHHWQCETTQLSVTAVYEAAGVQTPVLPRGLQSDATYDKWGNRTWPSGLRSWGPLESDVGARKSLQIGGVLGLMMSGAYAEAAGEMPALNK